MKRIAYILCIAAGALTMSCAKEELMESTDAGTGPVWEGIIDNDGSQTKTSLAANKTKVYWEYGDVIDFYGSSTHLGCGTVTNKENLDKKAVITQEKEFSTSPEFAVHNGTTADFSSGTKDNSLTFKIKQVQSGEFSDANISASKVISGSQTLRFRNLCTIFRVSVTSSDVNQVVIMSLKGTPITGTMTAVFGDDGSLKDARYTGEGTAAAQIDVNSPGTYYVALCPARIDAGDLWIFYMKNGGELNKINYAKALDLKAGEIYDWGDIKDHDTTLKTLPKGSIFNSYLKEVANGDLKNIKKIVFTSSTSEVSGKEIAKNTFMSYISGTVTVTKIALTPEFYANPDCGRMFENLSSLESIEGLNYVNTEAATDMTGMFSGCSKLSSLDLSSFNTSSVTAMGDMFYSCEGLELLDLTSFDTRKVTSTGYMFEWCWYLKEIFLGKNFIIPDGCFVDEMFLGDDVTLYGTSEEMESFQKALVPGSDFYSGCLQFAVDMGDAGWWSSWNVRADKPSEFGSYFSWGNGEGHWKNGTSDGYEFSVNSYKSTSGYSRQDAWESVNYLKSSLWRVPKAGDFLMLIENCNFSRTTLNGVSGAKLAHKTNGNWIFLPDAGYIIGSSMAEESVCWAGDKTGGVYYDFQNNSLGNKTMSSFLGLPVRPIAVRSTVPLTKISLGQEVVYMKKWETCLLTPKFTPVNAFDRSVEWTSSDPAVASVSNGMVVAHSAGSAIITATNKATGVYAQCLIAVERVDPVSFKLVNPFGGAEVNDGDTWDITESGNGSKYYGLKVVVTPANADYLLIWSHDDVSKTLYPVYDSNEGLGDNTGGYGKGSNPFLFSGDTEGKPAKDFLVCYVNSLDGKVKLQKTVNVNISVSEKQCLLLNTREGMKDLKNIAYFRSDGKNSMDRMYSNYDGMFDKDFGFYIHFSREIDQIPASAFQQNNGLKSVKLPSGVKYVGPQAFYKCEYLESVKFNNGLTKIGDNAFQACFKLNNLEFPSSLETIGSSAFAACSKLTKVTFNKGLKSIGGSAFAKYGVSSDLLSDFTLPETLEIISGNAFLNMGKSSITIPASVKYLGEESFGQCSALKTVRMEGTPPSSYKNGPFGPDTKNLTKIYVPYTYYSQYASDTWFSAYKSIIQTY